MVPVDNVAGLVCPAMFTILVTKLSLLDCHWYDIPAPKVYPVAVIVAKLDPHAATAVETAAPPEALVHAGGVLVNAFGTGIFLVFFTSTLKQFLVQQSLLLSYALI